MLRTLAGILIVILTASSCGNESATIYSPDGMGVLEGYVTSAGQGVATRVEARNMEEPYLGNIYHSTESDSTGWYRMELPTGLYRLEVKSRISEARRERVGDLIRVLPRVFRFDLKRGRAEVRVLMPEELESEGYSLDLESDYDANGRDSARVEDGILIFEFPTPPAGFYRMSIKFSGGEEAFYLPGTTNPGAGSILAIGTETPVIYEANFRDSLTIISGSVTGSWQHINGPGMTVEMIASDSNRAGGTNCSSDGTFELVTPVEGEVRFRSECGGVEQWFGGDSFETAQVFDLVAGDRIAGLSLVESGISLQFDGPGDQVNHVADVSILDESGTEYFSRFYWRSPIVINNLKPGLNYIYVSGHCSAESWAPQWYQGAEGLEGATPIDLAEGEMRSVIMELEAGAGIEGAILKPDGTQPNRAYVAVFDLEGRPLCFAWDLWGSFDDGLYYLRGLADGSYYLATLYLDVPLWYPGTWDLSEAVPLTIENATSLTGINIQRPALILEATP